MSDVERAREWLMTEFFDKAQDRIDGPLVDSLVAEFSVTRDDERATCAKEIIELGAKRHKELEKKLGTLVEGWAAACVWLSVAILESSKEE